METVEQVYLDRIKLMRITAALFVTLCAALMALMITYCNKKVVVISNYEEEISSSEVAAKTKNNVTWKVKTSVTKGSNIHIPVESTDIEYDMDYVNKIFTVKIPDDKGKFYMENVPYGDFKYVKDATGRFDGEYVTYTMPMNRPLEPKLELTGEEAVFSFASISHEKPIVLLDPGHGGNAIGNKAGGLLEKEVVLKIARKVEELSKDKDFKVILTRNIDRKVGMGECISIVNIVKADYYISLHLDVDVEDSKTFGMRASYNADYYRDGFENVDFADKLLRSVVSSTANKAVELFEAGEEELVLKVLKIPAATLYLGYISNTSEAGLLSEDAYIEKIAKGIVDALSECE